jgi:hypothetical protein
MRPCEAQDRRNRARNERILLGVIVALVVAALASATVAFRYALSVANT